MEQKALLRFLIIFLGFSYVLSSRTVPQSAFLKSGYEDPSIQQLGKQGLMEWRNYREELELEEATIRSRMDIETNDYSGTGANNDHQPKTPGRR